MRIGLIARADSTGLGVQSKGFFDHIPCKALVIDFSNMVSHGSYNALLAPNLDWYPGQQVFKWGNKHNLRGDIPKEVINEFLKDIDVVFAMETPYDYNIFDICRERGIKTILQPNYEFLDFPSTLPAPDLFAMPSMWNYENSPDRKIHLPVPVNTKHFTCVRKEKTFIHNIGRTAVHDRNGTLTFLESLNYVKNNINVIIRSQMPNGSINKKYGENINLTVSFANKKNYFDNYDGGVLVMPRRYGGLCLPINESIAAGMPVITTAISPNSIWLPNEWLVLASLKTQFKCKRTIDVFEADPVRLAQKIDEFCESDFYDTAIKKAFKIRDQISWEALLPLYHSTFNSL